LYEHSTWLGKSGADNQTSATNLSCSIDVTLNIEDLGSEMEVFSFQQLLLQGIKSARAKIFISLTH